jgi:hypothetical protein
MAGDNTPGINKLLERLSVIKDSIPQSDKEDFDKEFVDSNKKHRNWMLHMDHLYARISHPFIIFICFFVILAVFITFRYLDVYYNGCIKVVSQIHKDTGKTITYLATIVITGIITQFLEKRKK